jgi:uncharacterized protein
MKPIDLTQNNTVITPDQVKHPVGCGGTCGGKCGSKKKSTDVEPDGCCTTDKPCCITRVCCAVWALLPAFLLAGGIALAGWAIGCGIHQISASQRSVSVRGFSEREVKADLAIWNIGYVATGNDLAAVQEKVETDTNTIRLFLVTNGIEESEMIELPTNMTDLLSRDYRSEGADKNRYIVNAGIRIRSPKVDIVQKLSGLKIGGLIKSGVTLREGQQPVYLYTKLKEIKPQMVAEASEDARAAAQQFAKDSQATLGSMKSASQGVFQFLPRDQADGVQESYEINKTARVVTTVNYFLVD